MPSVFPGRVVLWAALLSGLRLWADDPPAPPSPPSLPQATNSVLAPSWVSRPLLSTNSASSTFLQNHPELNETPSLPAPVPEAVSPPVPPLPPIPPEPTEALSTSPLSGTSTPVLPTATAPEAPRPPSSPGHPGDLAAHLLVVSNRNDPESKRLADYYAQARHIPPERVLSIACPTTEEISRAQYNETVREPIMSYLCQMKWIDRQNEQVRVGNQSFDLLVATRNDIWAIVLMRGIPLKIAPDPNDNDGVENGAAFHANAAAVDSELALLPLFGLPAGGFVPNPFFDATTAGDVRVGPDLATKIILVTRLDGPSSADVRRMIDDSIYAEKNRLAGLAVIDTRGITDPANSYVTGDLWLRQSRVMLATEGWTVDFDDKPEVLPPTNPCNQVAIYLGWYGDEASGPWVTPPNRFVRGAVAYHLHSFSADTVRSSTRGWVGPLISHGAAATMGCVYEPYLSFTPHLDIFTRRLLDGDYFAEAAYASEPGLSWMVTVIGDPLYRPFAVPLKAALARAGSGGPGHHDWLLLQSLHRDLIAGRIPRNIEALKRVLDLSGTGGVAHEYLGDLLGELEDPGAQGESEIAYRKAFDLDTVPVDRIRVGQKLAQRELAHHENRVAEEELKSLHDLFPQEAERFGIGRPAPSHPPVSLNPPTPPVSIAPPAPPAPPGPPQARPVDGP